MFENFEAAFNLGLDSYSAFAILGLAYGQSKIYVEGDVTAEEVKAYLERHDVNADCYDLSNGVVVAIAGADESRARALLENWKG